jgi:hypothetical protein
MQNEGYFEGFVLWKSLSEKAFYFFFCGLLLMGCDKPPARSPGAASVTQAETAEAGIRHVEGFASLSPRDAVDRLRDEASTRVGEDVAALLFAAELMELFYLLEPNAATMNGTELTRRFPADSIEANLQKAFVLIDVNPVDKIAAIQAATRQFENMRTTAPEAKYKVYERVLTYQLPNVDVVDVLKLKEIEALAEAGQIKVAKSMMLEAESREWPQECRDYLSSIRLKLELQERDQLLFKGR